MTIEKTWTEEEITYLKENYATEDLEELAEHLNKSMNAVYQRANKLKLKRSKDSTVWPESDVAYLKEHFPTTDNEVIAEALSKSVSAIRNEAWALKLRKARHYWKPTQEAFLLEHYGQLSIEEISQKLDKSKWSIINKHRELTGLRKTGDKTIISSLTKNHRNTK